MVFKLNDKVRTIVSRFTDEEVKYGTLVYIHPTDKIAPYIVDFGDRWGGFMEGQLELDI